MSFKKVFKAPATTATVRLRTYVGRHDLWRTGMVPMMKEEFRGMTISTKEYQPKWKCKVSTNEPRKKEPRCSVHSSLAVLNARTCSSAMDAQY